MFFIYKHACRSFHICYFCGMSLADNIKAIREEKSLKQIEVATFIGVDKSAYSKIEKGMRAVTVEELQKMARLFEMTTDQIINFDGKIPTEVVLEDKTAIEQMKLIQQLDDEDKQTIFHLIEKMLTNKKFKDFFQKNVATL
jgi:transcriptional regulator with XRE-family HTH domain